MVTASGPATMSVPGTATAVRSLPVSTRGIPTISPTSTSGAAGNGTIESQLKRASEQNQAYLNEAKALYQPYADAGLSSLDEYMKLLLGGVDSLSGDKNFRAMQDLAERKVMANRATSGLLRSGATASALDDTLLQFANQYYGNRLNQLKEGTSLGYNTTGSQASILEKLGADTTDLASALANIQMTREGMENELKAAGVVSDANTYAAEHTGGLFGHGGFLGLGS